MKQTKVISLAVLILISIFFINYSQLQNELIGELSEENISLKKQAVELSNVAFRLQENIQETKADSRKLELELDKIKEELERCKSKNKSW